MGYSWESYYYSGINRNMKHSFLSSLEGGSAHYAHSGRPLADLTDASERGELGKVSSHRPAMRPVMFLEAGSKRG